MGERLTKRQLKEIEKKIDAISLRFETMNPSNSLEYQILSQDENELESLVGLLHKSYKYARIQEIGLQLIS